MNPVTRRERWRVAKKLLPGQPGTIKLARKHGQALVCVRYRLDAQGLNRCTTVELIVEQVEVVARADRTVAVKLRFEEIELRFRNRGGARWDQTAKVWRMSYRLAKELGLQSRIVEK
jgi:hypothetical protein